MMTRRSALPVRISYNVNVRSEPILASTDASERLNFTAEIVSVEVGKVRLEMGALLGGVLVHDMSVGTRMLERTSSRPIFVPG